MSDIKLQPMADIDLIVMILRDCAEFLDHGKPEGELVGYTPADLRQQADRLETWAAEACDALEESASIVIRYLPPSNLRSPEDALAEVTTLVDTHPAFKPWQPLSAVRFAGHPES